MQPSRRDLAVLLATAAAVSAQQPAPLAAGPADEATLVRHRYQRMGEALDKIEVPIGLEPAFRFEVL